MTLAAVGVWFFSKNSQRLLYLMRSGTRHAMTWALPGGKCDANEPLLDAIQRECTEEMGFMPDFEKIFPIEKFTSKDHKFVYHTFFCLVAEEFTPNLNAEHLGYAWIDHGTWPRPLHPGLWNTVNLHEIMQKIKPPQHC